MNYYGFVKAAAASPKIKVADPVHNAESICGEVIIAEEKGVNLLVFPELCITGYTAGDLLLHGVLLDSAKDSLKKIADFSIDKNMLIFVGLPLRILGQIYNVAAAVYNGAVIGITPKQNLPNYNEFYEKRYFSVYKDKDTTINLFGYDIPFGNGIIYKSTDNEGFTVAAEICEDLWVSVPPSARLSQNGANIIVNLSASNEIVGKAEYRRTLIVSQSARLVSGYIYADAAYGESTTDMVFSGHNLIAENGVILSEALPFSGNMAISDIDTDFILSERTKLKPEKTDNTDICTVVNFSTVMRKAKAKEFKFDRMFDKTPFIPSNDIDKRAKLILDIQAHALCKRAAHTKTKAFVIGVSGGLDSSLALIVAHRAAALLGEKPSFVKAVTMPCFGTTSRTKSNAVKLSGALKSDFITIDIKKAVTQHLSDIGLQKNDYSVTFENAQARERTQVLMDLANKTGGMVIGTGDLSELALGFATYNGDHMSMYGVNSSVPKTLIRYLIKYEADESKDKNLKKVLYDILDTPVSPELIPADKGKITQKTEDIVGPYVLHDFFLYHMIRKGASPSKIFITAVAAFKGEYTDNQIYETLKTFIKRFFSQAFKRSCLPDGPKIGSVSLSPRADFRMPSDAECSVWLNDLEKVYKKK